MVNSNPMPTSALATTDAPASGGGAETSRATPAGADFDAWAAQRAQRARELIERHVGAGLAPGASLGEAMHYAAALGGKRMRPLLVWATGECLGADPAALDAAALATELVHAYSLVHDDLPCMDNDVLRRGMPTVHVRFGEAMALLAGDALQTRAFEVLTGDAALAPALQARLCGLLAGAAGAAGMAGGQATDLLATGQRLDLDALRDMHARKTGALLRASVLMGVACAAERDAELAARCEPALRTYAENIGLAFQVVDDVLDASMDSATLGKTAGKDAEQGKATFVSLLGVEPARQYAQRLLDQALEALRRLPPPAQQRTQRLAELACRVLARSH